MVTRVSRRIGFGTGGGRSGVGGDGGGFVPGTGSGSRGGGGSLTNDDRARGEGDDLQKRPDTDGGQHREKTADDVGRKPVLGEDGGDQHTRHEGQPGGRRV